MTPLKAGLVSSSNDAPRISTKCRSGISCRFDHGDSADLWRRMCLRELMILGLGTEMQGLGIAAWTCQQLSLLF
ncbi:uncharacterized protein MYCFIDRAFT_174456 [Pseudocercospora fijiensis CIRAD86]|uniref:C3H1-type domain-containing protein n=1 Tax=Pseudocercospora fijiensis (strain CIRAD86) TaxID=383855 RepID=M2ZVB8_PSEFD|nr:uncharacterized protein MYCFIDRAFT_174456 [Pseudocercospora fijiensis CIRAD86]EME82949.1 hypothetical protein MYCFIDRAFT_174456 [Pseudocercospora fijiensis CIRAD86]